VSGEAPAPFDLTQLHFDDRAIARLRSILARYGAGGDPGIGLGISRDRGTGSGAVLLHVGIYLQSQSRDLGSSSWSRVQDVMLIPLFSALDGAELAGRTVTCDADGQLSVMI